MQSWKKRKVRSEPGYSPRLCHGCIRVAMMLVWIVEACGSCPWCFRARYYLDNLSPTAARNEARPWTIQIIIYTLYSMLKMIVLWMLTTMAVAQVERVVSWDLVYTGTGKVERKWKRKIRENNTRTVMLLYTFILTRLVLIIFAFILQLLNYYYSIKNRLYYLSKYL